MLKQYALLFAVGAGAIGALVYFGGKGVEVVAEVAKTKLNPLSAKNTVYDNIIGDTGRTLTDNPNWTLGGAIYDLFH